MVVSTTEATLSPLSETTVEISIVVRKLSLYKESTKHPKVSKWQLPGLFFPTWGQRTTHFE